MLALLLTLSTLLPEQGQTAVATDLPPHCLRVIDTHCGRVQALDISADGSRLAVGCSTGHVLLFETATGEQVGDLDERALVWNVAFDHDGKRLLAVRANDALV